MSNYSEILYDTHAINAYDSLQQGSNESTEAYLHRAQDILECIHHTNDMSSITAIGTNHVKILTSLKDSRLQNKLAKLKAKKWITMAQVLQDVADMAVDFERSRGYSLPTFDVQYISASNSSTSYRSNKPPTKSIQQSSTQPDKPKCWHCQGDHFKKDCPTAPKHGSPKYKTTKEKQHNLIKTFHKRFQDRRQINKISTPAEDNSNEEFNKFFSEFKNLMMEDSDDSSIWLVSTWQSSNQWSFHWQFSCTVQYTNRQAYIHKHCLIKVHQLMQYHLQFYSSMQQHLKMLPTSRKVVSADGNSLGPIGEVHVTFKIGKVVFNDIFIILNNLQCDNILGLTWQQNYRSGCMWNQEGKHFLTIKNKFLALSITPHTSKQLVTTKEQCTLLGRSITWISVKTPRDLQINSLFEITLDRQLPKGSFP